jgi:poly(A) polymerase
MALLGLKPGPVVGRAYKFLLEERMEHGPLDPAVAESRLRDWWAAQPEAAPAGAEPSTTEES